MPRPRGISQFVEPEFLATKKRMQELIHPESSKKETQLPMLRMTHAGDDVE